MKRRHSIYGEREREIVMRSTNENPFFPPSRCCSLCDSVKQLKDLGQGLCFCDCFGHSEIGQTFCRALCSIFVSPPTSCAEVNVLSPSLFLDLSSLPAYLLVIVRALRSGNQSFTTSHGVKRWKWPVSSTVPITLVMFTMKSTSECVCGRADARYDSNYI